MFGVRRVINYSANLANARLDRATLQRLRTLKGLIWRESVGIRQIKPVNAYRSSVSEPRINLLIPSISEKHAYGGISTVLKFFNELAQHYRNVRIVLIDISPFAKDLSALPGYSLVSMRDDLDTPKQVVSLADRYERILAVGAEDIFVATLGHTAYLAQQIALWQSREFNQPVKPFVYFIQDYEPGFYPWSSHYLLVHSTYEYEGPTVAVFNTDLLKQYFHAQGLYFDHEYSFEPQMNETLRNLRPSAQNMEPAKYRQLLVYGRPSKPRNAFELVVETLRIWQSRFPQASRWTVLSVGELHRNVDLGEGIVMKSVGKLSLEAYARVLSESSVGLSLMVSPHPSYPPLEMAHYGMWVLTNNYANKDLSLWHDNIISLRNCSPTNLASNLVELCQRVEADPTSGWRGRSHLRSYLSSDSPFPFVEEIRRCLNGLL